MKCASAAFEKKKKVPLFPDEEYLHPENTYGSNISNIKEEEEDDGRALNSFIFAGVVYTFAIAITFVSKPALILSAVGNDASAGAIFTGVILSAQSLVSAFATPFFGSLSDATTGRVPILLFSIAVECISLVFIVYFRSSVYGVFLGFLLMATADCTGVTVLSAIADLAKRGTSTAAFAKYNALVGTTIALGPLLGGLVVAVSSPYAPFLLAAAILSISYPFFMRLPNAGFQAGSLWTSLKEAKLQSPLPTIRESLCETKALTILSASLIIASLAENSLLAVMYLYLNASFRWESFQFGLYISVNGFFFIAGQLLAPKLAAKFGERRLVVAGFMSSALHCFVIASTNKQWALWASLLCEIPSFAAIPVRNAVLARQVDSKKQASLQGSIAALQSLVRPIASLGSAAIFALSNQRGMPEFVFYPVTIVFLMAAAISEMAMAHPELKSSKDIEPDIAV